jgi:type III pantothenate kinase
VRSTALTVDVVVHRDDAPGRFLGGAIAPGPDLLAGALAAGAANLFPVTAQPGDAALGHNSEAALRAGVANGFRGAARELVEGVAREAGVDTAPVALTGGARTFLLAPEPFTDREVAVLPDLVHLGLVSSLLDARTGPLARP